jgi:hypothetical protein
MSRIIFSIMKKRPIFKNRGGQGCVAWDREKILNAYMQAGKNISLMGRNLDLTRQRAHQLYCKYIRDLN